MPLVDLVDDTFVVADAAVIARVVAEPARWQQWWPDLSLRVLRDRGVEGLQLSVSGGMAGTAELWLEPWLDGVVVHLYLRLDPPVPRAGAWADEERRRRAVRWKGHVHALKDALEAGRRPGTARVQAGGWSGRQSPGWSSTPLTPRP